MLNANQNNECSSGGSPRKVEIGWLLEGDLPSAERKAAKAAAEEMRRSLEACLVDFDWTIEIVERPLGVERGIVEPVRLLDAAEVDRDVHFWDFVIVITARELRGRKRDRILGVTAGLFGTALLSTAFLCDSDTSKAPLAKRIHALAMQLFGSLNGLPTDRENGWMQSVEDGSDLDELDGYIKPQLEILSERLEEVADLRVEEMSDLDRNRIDFYFRSLWQNRGALPGAILRMRPWSFPLRLRRMTTAAISALAVLVMTAESWEVAANLSITAIAIVSTAAVAGTSTYLIQVQSLLASRRGPLREQRVVSNSGTAIAVVMGMAVTYAGVFLLAWLLAAGLFGDELLSSWTNKSEAEALSVRLRLASLAASFSVIIGALGASFEPYGYFRHVMQIDDEI